MEIGSSKPQTTTPALLATRLDPLCAHCGQLKSAHQIVNWIRSDGGRLQVLICPTAIYKELR